MPAAILHYLQHWGLPDAATVRATTRGNNNTLWIVDETYVLRRYDTLGAERVTAEHRLLEALALLDLPFAVPAPIRTLDGRTEVDQVALFPYLPGEPATSSHLAQAGAALAELDIALAELPISLAPYDWREGVHPAVPDVAALSDELAEKLPGHPGAQWFSTVDADVDDSGLPKQIVHGDWALGNILVENGRVTAALDFEIAGLTVRVNDIVAGFYSCLDVTDPATTSEQVQAFCRAYLRRIDLSDAERNAFPELLRLRAFARCIWRAGRWRRGQNSLDSVADALLEGRRLEQWLAASPNPLLR